MSLLTLHEEESLTPSGGAEDEPEPVEELDEEDGDEEEDE